MIRRRTRATASSVASLRRSLIESVVAARRSDSTCSFVKPALVSTERMVSSSEMSRSRPQYATHKARLARCSDGCESLLRCEHSLTLKLALYVSMLAQRSRRDVAYSSSESAVSKRWLLMVLRGNRVGNWNGGMWWCTNERARSLAM